MEHVIGPKRTLLIVGADEADVRDFVGSARAHAVPRKLWPESERFETTGCTPADIPGDRFVSRAFDAVIVTKNAAGCEDVPVRAWRWQEPVVLMAQPLPSERRITGITCNHCGAALDPGDLPAAMDHERACRPAARAVVRMARGSAPREVTP